MIYLQIFIEAAFYKLQNKKNKKLLQNNLLIFIWKVKKK